ncbi:serine hydrolase domain-containing protein [Massilia antarctica]|uniref:serine hydrolase domain-containing protein n=1 Tax=Massilia antarctica TaxID=2765360 RepID=UPI0006BB6E83|nr:serine hydrolase domain-containing protein [Massilia sp. H27-R4]MCY0912753.1 serine hydrolase [Massilia sp. H27-R4]CUI03824.1 Beta-lactamase [Janthinobacterium sp. CG23_2]CUU27610.1 Beta-lactamase [Janthinobacterium sp. CG23_2]
MKLLSYLPGATLSVSGAAFIALLAGCGGGSGGGGRDVAANAGKSLGCVAQHPGASVAELLACSGDLNGKIDAVMTPFMAANGITAATVAVAKDGVMLAERGYGHRDSARQIPLPADAMFITASIVKPVTAASIQTLARERKLALTDHVFCTGLNAPCWLAPELQPAAPDVRIGAITIAQLLEHQGGWDADISGDPMVSEYEIQQALGLSAPPQQDDIIRFVLRRPLDFAPGTKTAYANFGYLLLGQIIEKASGLGYVQYVQENIMRPIGIPKTDFEGMRSLLVNRHPRGPDYITTVTAPSVFVPGATVLAFDGAVRIENWVAAGATVTTAKAMTLFAAHYRIPDGVPLAGATNNAGFSGADPGVATVLRQLPSGVSYAVMMNKLDESNPSGGASYQVRIVERIEAALKDAGM